MKKKRVSITLSPIQAVAAFFVLLSLAVPWRARAEADVCEGNGYKLDIGNGFQLRHKDAEICSYRAGDDAVILLKDWPGLSRDVIEHFVDIGYQTDAITLVKRGELQQIVTAGGDAYLARVAGIVRNKPVEGVAGGFVGKDGQGVAVLIASVADKWSEFEKQANAVIESIEFTGFEQRIGAREWRRMLSGAGLSYRVFSDYGDARENYYFCSDGRFYSSSRRSGHANRDGDASFGFSSSMDSGEWDLWNVQGGTQLVLFYNNGRERRANIEDRNGETWIDDTRYYMIENRRCR